MKKLVMCMAAMAMMGMMMTSCQKEEESSTTEFTAYAESANAKTDLGANDQMVWALGDQIFVHNYVKSVGHYYSTFEVNRTYGNGSAHLNGSITSYDNKTNLFEALYPASMHGASSVTTIVNKANDDHSIFKQTYKPNSIDQLPMYAPSQSTTTLKFQNLCGVLRLNLQSDANDVQKITITTIGKNIRNTDAITKHKISNTDSVYSFDAKEVGSNGVYSLNCGEGVDISNPTDFNIVLPCGDYSGGFQIAIKFSDNTTITKSLNSGATFGIERNKIYNLTFDLNQNLPL